MEKKKEVHGGHRGLMAWQIVVYGSYRLQSPRAGVALWDDDDMEFLQVRGDDDEKGVFPAGSCRSSCKNHFNKYVEAILRSGKKRNKEC